MGQTVRIDFRDTVLVGRNRHGYTFAVGRVGFEDSATEPPWLGFAVGELPDGSSMVFVFPGVGEGGRVGLADRDEAIRRTCAVALDPASGYGGVDEWAVPPELRGDPESYRCPVCGEVCCDEDHFPRDLEGDW